MPIFLRTNTNKITHMSLSQACKDDLREAEASDDDEAESQLKSTTHASSVNEEKEKFEIGNKETKQVSYIRAVVLAVLVAVATSVSAVVFLYSRDVEQDAFETHFSDLANKITSGFIYGAERRIEAINSFANQITSYAIAQNSEWPNVALPDFERRAKFILELSDVLSLIFLPIVTKDARESWETFSVENQGWIREGLDAQGIPEDDYDRESIDVVEETWGTSPNLTIPTEIFKVAGTGIADENGPGPYMPWWQFAPALPLPTLVNYNTMSHPTRQTQLEAITATKQRLCTKAWDYSDDNAETVGKKPVLNLFLQHGGANSPGDYQAGPVSDLYMPIFDNYSEDKQLVGTLAAYIYWQVYFEDILPPNEKGVLVVLENSCDQQYSYVVNGHDVEYIGQGDLHQTKYDDLEVSTEWGSFVHIEFDELDDIPEGQCLYKIRVFPSQKLEDAYITSGPLQSTAVLVSAFIFTCMTFILYDFLVERRQRLVMKTAELSTAVVASLFPEAVRDRLYHEKEEKKHQDPKKQDKNYMMTSTLPTIEPEEEDIAIADLYPHCTVQFADIVGFTRWSSTRQPTEVFRLLETIYKSFDKIAVRLGVFKVETIGDCYLAVTGLPKPQDDHAIIMARFAAECDLKMGRVTHRLAEKLGADTSQLTLRFGLHSGPVTAGVLRGAKARFQLFGDTVNTAARMESTGVPGRIQVSTTTAGLIIAGGNTDWVRQREDEVEAKGKGKLRTYWLQPKVVAHSSTGSVISVVQPHFSNSPEAIHDSDHSDLESDPENTVPQECRPGRTDH
jgi:class 3 adenylate cyclase